MNLTHDENVLNPVKAYKGGLIGYAFNCPGCKRTHTPYTEQFDNHPTWEFNGDLKRPTFSPSILSKYRHPEGYSNSNPAPLGYDGPYIEEVCHSFIRDGQIEFLGDCTHELAGQTVPLQAWNGYSDD